MDNQDNQWLFKDAIKNIEKIKQAMELQIIHNAKKKKARCPFAKLKKNNPCGLCKEENYCVRQLND